MYACVDDTDDLDEIQAYAEAETTPLIVLDKFSDVKVMKEQGKNLKHFLRHHIVYEKNQQNRFV